VIALVAPVLKSADLPASWVPAGSPVLEELIREVGPRHRLFRHVSTAVPLARSEAADDVLYWIEDLGQFACVHLTWKAWQNELDNSVWPVTGFYDSFEDWKRDIELDDA
jgi:hypothetical protein